MVRDTIHWLVAVVVVVVAVVVSLDACFHWVVIQFIPNQL